MSDIEQRLREAHPISQQYANGSKILLEAADEITRLQADNEALRRDMQGEPECGCCGQTVKCDDDCDAVVLRKAERQPTPDVEALVEVLEQVMYCNEVGFLPVSVQESVSKALAAHRNGESDNE